MTITEAFLNYLEAERNYSPLTVKNYGDDLLAFEMFFKTLDNHITCGRDSQLDGKHDG